MRAAWVALCALTVGCATTVHRLDGDVIAPLGPAKTACEKDEWLVLAPTRAELTEGRRAVLRDDGLGLYKVGGSSPENIPDLKEEFPDSEIVRRHANAVSKHDDERLLAAGLGAAGLIALGVGTMLFVSSFESKRDARGEETQQINGGRAAASGLVLAGGFGLGIAGIVTNPSQAERARADAARHVFLRPEDDTGQVDALVARHNGKVRARCERPNAR